MLVESINPTTIAVKNGTVSSSITIRASLRMLKLEILTRVDHHLVYCTLFGCCRDADLPFSSSVELAYDLNGFR